MSGTLAPKVLKSLQQIHRLMLELETGAGSSQAPRVGLDSSEERPFTEASLEPLRKALLALPEEDAPIEIQKIRAIAHHLHAGMTLKQFTTWLVPVERVLGRELRDDQFLIYSKDGSVASSAEINIDESTSEKLPLVFVLDNLRSAFNVGSIFRTAECFGVSKIFLTGYTPLPDQEKLAKTAMGTDALVSWESVAKISDLLARLKNDGYQIVAFETTSHAADVEKEFYAQPTVFVFGNERFGLEASLLELCDEVRKIPLRGQKNSLNVGVATAIATYEFARQFAHRHSATGSSPTSRGRA